MRIDHCWQFNLALAQGPYAWPGGYAHHFWCADGEALSWDAAVANAALIRNAIIAGVDSEWRVVGMDINWEDQSLYCSHTNHQITPEHED